MTQVALVTGAARGIGAATCRQLAADGWSVVAVDRASDDPRLPYRLGTADELDRVVADCARTDGDAVALVADTTDPVAMTGAVEQAVQRFGGLDAAVAVAGVIAGGKPLWEMAEDEVSAVVDVNLGGVITLARVAIPALLRQPVPRQGRFIAVASVAARRGLPLLAAYCASKAGVVGLIQSLALELAGTGVTAVSVSPGSTDTHILAESARLYGLPSAQAFAEQQPVGRLIEPAEIAAAIAWLAAPTGAAVTGVDIPVDGGLSL